MTPVSYFEGPHGKFAGVREVTIVRCAETETRGSHADSSVLGYET